MNDTKQMKAAELAEAIGKAWVMNDGNTFISLFAKEAQIVHPYFKQPVIPSVAFEVINTTVKPTTVLRKSELQFGDGEGKDDVMRLVFQEGGNEIGRDLGHISEIIVTAEIKNHYLAKLIVHGFDVKTDPNTISQSSYKRRDIGNPTSKKIANMLAKCWGTNDMDTFVSLFSSDAKIAHPGLDGEVSPEVIADVMNSDISAVSELKTFNLLQGDGSGQDDVIEIQSEEIGEEVEYLPKVVGTMSATISIKAHRIVHIQVHGYQVVDQQLA